MNWLVIGIGNTLRRDDGLGPWLADRISEWRLPNVTTRSVHQLTPELAVEIANYEHVLFLDACVECVAESGSAIVEVAPSAEPNRLGHALTPGNLLALAGGLGMRHPRAWIATVMGSDFRFEEALTTAAARRGERALLDIGELLRGAASCTKSA